MNTVCEKYEARSRSRHTFVVLRHKDSAHLPECLASLAAQTEQSRIVLSTATPSVFQRRMAKEHGLQLAVNKKHRGIAEDWNFALRLAETEYVTLAHQDDIYEADFARSLCDAMDTAADAVIGFSDYGELRGVRIVRNMSLAIKRLLLLPFRFSANTLRARWLRKLVLAFGSPVPCPAVTYRTAMLSGFSFSPDFSVSLDWEAWLRLADAGGSFVRVPEILMWHRIHEGSETTAGIAGKKREREDALLFSRSLPPVLSHAARALYSLSYLSNRK